MTDAKSSGKTGKPGKPSKPGKPGKPGKTMSPGMKSAYEIALERMESQGIDRPDENLAADVRDRAAEIRTEAEAKIAELEILHRDRNRTEEEPADEEEYRLERRRILERRDAKLEALRSQRS